MSYGRRTPKIVRGGLNVGAPLQREAVPAVAVGSRSREGQRQGRTRGWAKGAVKKHAIKLFELGSESAGSVG